MSDQGLLPCPFCGGEAGLVGIRDGYMVACKAGIPCFARGPSIFHGPGGWDVCQQDAIAAWNTRTPPTTGDNPVPISNIKDKTDGN